MGFHMAEALANKTGITQVYGLISQVKPAIAPIDTKAYGSHDNMKKVMVTAATLARAI